MGLRQPTLNSHDLRGEIAPTAFCLKGRTSETTVSNGYALRRSLTCGDENPAFQAVRRRVYALRRSLTCGDENSAFQAVRRGAYALRRLPACGYESPDFWVEILDVCSEMTENGATRLSKTQVICLEISKYAISNLLIIVIFPFCLFYNHLFL
ncbi:MAG: hypothetical protein LBF55_01730 [Prevotellaceae bacterium]|jgi:hypothetical protein|nr:hypothetical protein [Prevotellaceae bacterium]